MIPELQHQFQDAVLAGKLQPTLATGHFEIYVNAYRGRLAEALRDNYPVLYRAMGDEAFGQLARAYIAEHPSRFRSIRWFGDNLTAFSEANPELLPHPALADLARMDWALRGAFDAADSATLSPADVATIAAEKWPGQCFVLQPAVRLITLQWNVEPIWQALNQDENAVTDAPQVLQHSLLVWRRELECHWRSLDAREATALRVIADGGTFAEVCESLAVDEANPAQTAAMYLRQWIEHGLLAKVL